MHLKVLDLYKGLLLLHLLGGSCLVFHPACLSSCDVDIQLLHQYLGSRLEDSRVFGLSVFATFASSSILFTWFLHACLLILSHLMTS